jgi:hypothetical protein
LLKANKEGEKLAKASIAVVNVQVVALVAGVVREQTEDQPPLGEPRRFR